MALQEAAEAAQATEAAAREEEWQPIARPAQQAPANETPEPFNPWNRGGPSLLLQQAEAQESAESSTRGLKGKGHESGKGKGKGKGRGRHVEDDPDYDRSLFESRYRDGPQWREAGNEVCASAVLRGGGVQCPGAEVGLEVSATPIPLQCTLWARYSGGGGRISGAGGEIRGGNIAGTKSGEIPPPVLLHSVAFCIPPPPRQVDARGSADARSSTDACLSEQKVQRREANRRRHRLTEPTTKALCHPPPPLPANFWGHVTNCFTADSAAATGRCNF